MKNPGNLKLIGFPSREAETLQGSSCLRTPRARRCAVGKDERLEMMDGSAAARCGVRGDVTDRTGSSLSCL